MRHANGIGSVAVGSALLLLLVGLILRTSGFTHFVLLALWGALPYAIMLIAHRRLKPVRWPATVSLVVSLLVAAFGIWLTLDALFIHFGTKSAGIAMFLLPLYQLPAVAVAVVACLLAKRAARESQPPNHAYMDSPHKGSD
jgi:hypothetical protein